jgi:hypothetical protein
MRASNQVAASSAARRAVAALAGPHLPDAAAATTAAIVAERALAALERDLLMQVSGLLYMTDTQRGIRCSSPLVGMMVSGDMGRCIAAASSCQIVSIRLQVGLLWL